MSEFRKAKASELDEIMKIIDDAKAFMKASGLNQWQDGYPNRESIAEDIKRGETYVLTRDGHIAATALVTLLGEPCYDVIEGEWKNSEPFVTVHKVAAAGELRGKGATSEMFSEIEKYALENGMRNIKIDTHRDNLRMQGFLKKTGFEYCGVVEVFTFGNDRKRMGFQKILK